MSLSLNRRPGNPCRWIATLAICCTVHWAACGATLFAQEGESEFHAYTLHYAKAAELKSHLDEVVGDLVEEGDIEVDQRNNRLLVHGPSEVHRLARDLIKTLDRKRPTSNRSTRGTRREDRAAAVVRRYHWSGNDLDQVVDDLQREFADEDLRISSDPRTSQVLVKAPLSVQSRVVRRLNALADAADKAAEQADTQADEPETDPRATPSSRSSRTAKAGRSRSKSTGRNTRAAEPEQEQPETTTVLLHHALVEDLELSLAELWGDSMQRLGTKRGALASYAVELRPGTVINMYMNHRAREIVLDGPAPDVALFSQLVEALDRPGQAPEGELRVVRVQRSNRAPLRQVIDILEQGLGEGETTVVRQGRRALPAVARILQPRNDEEDVADESETSREDSNDGDPNDGDPNDGDPNDGDDAATMEGENPDEMQAQPGDEEEQPSDEEPTDERPGGRNAEDTVDPAQLAAEMSLLGPVQIEYIEALDALIVRGAQRDVDIVLKIIEEIEKVGGEPDLVIEVYSLKHVGAEAMSTVVTQLYDQVLSPRQGRVSITALGKPNALLLIGREDSVKTVKDLIKRLDQPGGATMQFEVFRLKHANAAQAQTTITQFFTGRTGLAGRVTVTADMRSNAVIVQASPRDLVEVKQLIDEIDTGTSDAVNELKVIKLIHSLAEDLAPILQDAMTAPAAAPGQRGGQGQGQQGFQQGQGQGGPFGQGGNFAQQLQGAAQQPGQPGAVPGQNLANQAKSLMLRFLSTDAEGQNSINSGILADVRITADPRANSLLVSAPAESMDLIEAVIRALDKQPATLAQIKVFTVVNGDATSMVDLLETLFSAAVNRGQGGVQPLVSGGEGSLLPLRFSVDRRTNSIIASGASGDLNVVEAILLRLDESDVRQRQSAVYRLKNAPAADVANAINEFLRTERQAQQVTPGLLSPFEQIEREVVVVPEQVTNSLVVSATPRFFTEIEKLVRTLDARPAMVMIQVLIAEVSLQNTDEFGVELGLQDSVLFDRSLLSNIQFQTTSTQQAVPGGGTITTQNQNIIAADNTPGFLFNNQPLGNAGSSNALRNGKTVGSQGLTNFSVGRINGDLGFGGLVLSASSESVSILIRALKESRRLDVLSRPQITTLDNQPAFVQVGQRVPRVTGTQTTQVGQTNQVVLENVGLIMAVTPRISPENLVVMEIDTEKSQLAPESEGIPISISANGSVIRSPRIDTTFAQTTVSAMDGQTIVLSGLLTDSKTVVQRRVPLVSSIPILGRLFRYDGVSKRKTELLIIMTPHVIRTEEDSERVKQTEVARMHWCLGDVRRLHGDGALRGRQDEWYDGEVRTVYPDGVPAGEMLPDAQSGGSPTDAGETVPSPEPSNGPDLLPGESPDLPPDYPPTETNGVDDEPADLPPLPPEEPSVRRQPPGNVDTSQLRIRPRMPRERGGLVQPAYFPEPRSPAVAPRGPAVRQRGPGYGVRGAGAGQRGPGIGQRGPVPGERGPVVSQRSQVRERQANPRDNRSNVRIRPSDRRSTAIKPRQEVQR